jgi:TnpA family transposase
MTFLQKNLFDWDLIKTYYHDMLIVVISIFKGKIKASTILRKLCSKSRKNKLYFAFRELGRVVRTIFLFNHINDPELRKMIQAATCKSEEFNEFISWIKFGDGDVISDNLHYNQAKIIKFGHFLANM